MSKINITHPRALIHTEFNSLLNIKQQRIFLYSLKKTKEKINYYKTSNPSVYEEWERGEINLLPLIELEIKELKRIFPVLRKMKKKDILENIEALEEIHIKTINFLNKDILKSISFNKKKELKDINFDDVSKIESTNLISHPTVDYENDRITFYPSPVIVAYLANPNIYVNYNVLITNFIHTPYAIKLFIFLTDFFSNYLRKNSKMEIISVPEISIENLKKIFDMSVDSYKRYTDFKRYVLVPSVKELNSLDVVPFTINVKELKINKKVDAIIFELKKKKNYYDVILSGNNIKKISKTSVNDEENKNNDYLTILEDLKQKVKEGTIIYALFKKELLKLKEVAICNKVENYQPHLVLRANEFGHLEFLNPDDNSVISLSTIDAEKIKKWLFKNPDRLGDIKKINVKLESIKAKAVGKYCRIVKNGFKYYLQIIDVLHNEVDNAWVFKAHDLIYNTDVMIKKTSDDEVNDFLTILSSEKDEDVINEYAVHNLNKEVELLEDFFNKHKTKSEDFIKYLEKELDEVYNKYDNEKDPDKQNDYALKLEKLSEVNEKFVSLVTGEKINTLDKKYVLKEFKSFIEKEG